ncbi:hypothetical protein EZV62_022138 [Acer yangbiense]|uniref:Uncharacterized protein n=1 Tax=Acer yangbiense TaxID=1000413 RepID=A0A5C7H8D1_9ROSI|nr:hypothetical protein EZV62_022138 [Acer yangbiense]
MVCLLGLFFEVRDARMHSDLNPGLQILRIILRRLAIVRSTGHWLPDFSLLNNDWSWSVSRVMSFVLESEKMLRRHPHHPIVYCRLQSHTPAAPPLGRCSSACFLNAYTCVDVLFLVDPFFVLHKASSGKSERKSTGSAKTRRRIDLSPSLQMNAKNLEAERVEECDDDCHVNLRVEAFEIVWSKIESTIKNVLRDVNINVFNEIHQWVRQSFNTIMSSRTIAFSEATQAFPIITDASSKQLFTGLVLSKNMEFVDDLLTFEELGLHLRSQGCRVANLSSLDFTAKSGINGCLRSLLRQFVMASLDAADISILASWYREQRNYGNPVVVIVEDIERCCGSVLSGFILMLRAIFDSVSSLSMKFLHVTDSITSISEWVFKVPVILIMGVATTLDSPRNILPSDVLQHLNPCKFTLGTPTERIDAVIEAVLVKPCSGFSISHKVALFLRNYFARQDGTLTSFIRALKIACVQHFSMEPLSFILGGLSSEEDGQVLQDGLLLQMVFKHDFDLPSYARNKPREHNGESFTCGLSELKKLQKHWGIMVLCLYEAGKYDKIRLLDLLCEALDPDLYNFRTIDTGMELEEDPSPFSSNYRCRQQYPVSRKGGFIGQVVRKVRDLPIVQLCKLLQRWEELTVDVIKIHEKLKELRSILKPENGKSSKEDMANISKRHASQSQLYMEDTKAVYEKAVILMECMVRDYMQPIESVPLHEVFYFKNVEKLQLALIGDPRRRIQVDLLESHIILCCRCCSGSGKTLLPTMHDTSIMYNLAQEHGDLINLHDWYQSFKSTVVCPRSKWKQKSKQSPLSKKRKNTTEPENLSEAAIQYPTITYMAVTELQITGLIRMPSKRRPDFVQRVAFGL